MHSRSCTICLTRSVVDYDAYPTNRSIDIFELDHGCAMIGLWCSLGLSLVLVLYVAQAMRCYCVAHVYSGSSDGGDSDASRSKPRRHRSLPRVPSAPVDAARDRATLSPPPTPTAVANDTSEPCALCNRAATTHPCTTATHRRLSPSRATRSATTTTTTTRCTCAARNHGVTHLAIIMDGNRRYGKRHAPAATAASTPATTTAATTTTMLTGTDAHALQTLCRDICHGNDTDDDDDTTATTSTARAVAGAARSHDDHDDSNDNGDDNDDDNTAKRPRAGVLSSSSSSHGWVASRYARFLQLIAHSPLDGHRCGAEQLERVITYCIECRIPMLTVYAFSTDNWHRSTLEVDVLMTLFMCFFDRIRPVTRRQGIFVRFISTAPQRLPPRVLALMRAVEMESRHIVPRNITVNVCVSYSGTSEIAQACDRLAVARVAAASAAAAAAATTTATGRSCGDAVQPVTEAELQRQMLRSITQDEHEAMDANVFSEAVTRSPQLLVRTSGERRVSNFMLYESAYTELFFMDKTWPEMTRADLLDALHSYATRERRLGR